MTRKSYAGKVTISRISPNNTIHIQIEDSKSGIIFVRAEMRPEDFGKALTGLSYQDCMFELYKIESVGKTREVKVEFVPFEDYHTADEVIEMLESFEVNGWEARKLISGIIINGRK